MRLIKRISYNIQLDILRISELTLNGHNFVDDVSVFYGIDPCLFEHLDTNVLET